MCVCVCVYVYVWERQEKIRSATIPRVTSSTYFQVNDNYYPGRTCAAVCPAAVPADNCIIYMAVGGSGRFLLLGNARDFSSFPWREDADAIVRNAHCKGTAMDQERERERERAREREKGETAPLGGIDCERFTRGYACRSKCRTWLPDLLFFPSQP